MPATGSVPRGTRGLPALTASAAANGMNDFHPVAVAQHARGVLATRHDVAVHLDRKTLAGKTKFVQQRCQ